MQLTFSHEFCCRLGNLIAHFVAFLQNGVDGFSSCSNWNGYFLHDTVGTAANSNPSTLHVREQERPQFTVFAKKIGSHSYESVSQKGAYLRGAELSARVL